MDAAGAGDEVTEEADRRQRCREMMTPTAIGSREEVHAHRLLEEDKAAAEEAMNSTETGKAAASAEAATGAEVAVEAPPRKAESRCMVQALAARGVHRTTNHRGSGNTCMGSDRDSMTLRSSLWT